MIPEETPQVCSYSHAARKGRVGEGHGERDGGSGEGRRTRTTRRTKSKE